MSKFPALTEAIINKTLVEVAPPSPAYPEMRFRSLTAFSYPSTMNLELDKAGLPRYLTYLRTDNLDSVQDAGNNLFVPATRLTDKQESYDAVDKRRTDAITWIREAFDADDELRDGIDLSLDQANELLALLGGDAMTHTKEFEFSFTISYNVSGTIVAVNEDAARQYVDALAENMDDPDYIEPSLDEDGEEWSFIGVEYSDTEAIEIW
jgi:hypothetical protein